MYYEIVIHIYIYVYKPLVPYEAPVSKKTSISDINSQRRGPGHGHRFIDVKEGISTFTIEVS